MKVLQMLPALEGGGVERGTLEIADALVRAGHEALVMSAGGSMVGELAALGGRHIELGVGAKSPLSLRLIPRIRRWLRDENVDIVHARSRLPAWLAWYALRGITMQRRPHFVTTVHGFYSVGRYSAIMTRGDRVICVSEAIRRYVQENYPPLPAEKLVTIHRGIDHALFPHGYRPDDGWLKSFRESLGAPSGRQLLLLPGRITRRKGHEVFIDLVRNLVDAGLDVHGVIAGGEDPRRRAYAGELRRRVAAQGLATRISFLGNRTDLREVMAACDLVLSLSTKPESFGRTVLEALSLGRPTLGFDHGGVGEILAALYPAGAVPLAPTGELTVRAQALLENPVPVAAGKAFPLAQMQDSTVALYESLGGAVSASPR